MTEFKEGDKVKVLDCWHACYIGKIATVMHDSKGSFDPSYKCTLWLRGEKYCKHYPAGIHCNIPDSAKLVLFRPKVVILP